MTESNDIFLPMDSRVAPPFHQIEPLKFQCICRDLLERQTDQGIASCGIFGEPGQKQFGIDLIAPLAGSDGNDVAQCKGAKEMLPQDIVEASDEFLKHTDYWRPFNLRRFILISACVMDRRQQQEALQNQRRRFAEVGIEYVWWDARAVRQRLAPYPDIIRLYCPLPQDYWVQIICGPGPETVSAMVHTTQSFPITMDFVESQLKDFAVVISEDVSGEIEQIRELHREGRTNEAHRLIQEVRTSKKWSLLQKGLQAKTLRVMASLELAQSRNIDLARSLLEQSRTLDPEADDMVARALVAYYESNGSATAALEVLATPLSTEALNLKIAFTIEKGSFQEALEMIESLPIEFEANAETYQVKALTLLGMTDLAGAKQAIDLARTLKPQWEGIRTVEAIVWYFESISPGARPRHYLVWPEAVPWMYVKRDSESMAHLRWAAAHFHDLSEKPTNSVEHKRQFEIWKLACLANDPERQPQAIEFCRKLLDDDAGNYHALAWAANRNFDVDFKVSERELERIVVQPITSASDERIEMLIVLAAIYGRADRADQSRKLLRRKEKELRTLGLGDLVAMWGAGLYGEAGNAKKMLELGHHATNPEIRRKIMGLALHEQLRRTQKWKPLARYLTKQYRRYRRGEDLFELCDLMASRGRWKDVVERSDELIAAVATPDAVRIVAIALSKSGLNSRCVRLLDDTLHLFPKGNLTHELMRVRIHCERRLGALGRALADAEELVGREDTAANIIALLNVQLQKADLKGLALTARRMLDRQDFTAGDVLSTAKVVLLEDRELAIRLWRQVKEVALTNDALVGEAIGLGYALGLDREVGPFQARMREMAKSGDPSVTSLSLTKAVEHYKRRAGKLNEIFGDYTRGDLMLHLFSHEVGAPLVEWLHGLPAENRSTHDLRHRPAVYARHGGNSICRSILSKGTKARLHMDITALLLAADLEVLDAVEEAFTPIRVSEAIPLALIQQLEMLTPNQPSQVAVNREIVAKIEDHRLQIIPERAESPNKTGLGLIEGLGEFWINVAEQAMAESAYIMDHLPLRNLHNSDRSSKIPEILKPHLISCRSVAESLHNFGPLSDVSYEQAIRELGDEVFLTPETPIPVPKSRIYLMGATAQVLSTAGLLDLTCEHFQAFIPASVIQLSRAGVQEHRHSLELVDWLKQLIERVRIGLDKGIYEVISADNLPERNDEESTANHNLTTLNDLLHFKVETGDVVWVDDRFVNGFGQREGAPILSVTDILRKLLTDDKIDTAQYYNSLLKLRRSNIRYLPLDSEEILFHLRQTHIAGGGLVETEEMASLRQYIAACLLDGENLQRSPQPEGAANRFGEINFVYETVSGVSDAIATIWADENLATDYVELCSDWLLNNLYIGRFGCRHLLPDAVTRRSDEGRLLGIDIAELFAKGITISESPTLAGIKHGQDIDSNRGQKERSRRQLYFHWLTSRFVFFRAKADPDSIAAAAEVMRNLLKVSSNREFRNNTEQREVRQLMQQAYVDLPNALQEQIKQDPNLLAWIGIKVAEAIQINGIAFPADDFWPAAEIAMNGGTALVEAFNQVTPLRLQRVHWVSATNTEGDSLTRDVEIESKYRASDRVLEIYDEEKLLTRFENAMLGLLDSNKSERVNALKANTHWFDTDPVKREREILEIAGMINPRERVDRTNLWGKRSIATFYLGLQQRLRANNRFELKDFTEIEAIGLLRFYRFNELDQVNLPFALKAGALADRLLSEEGVAIAVDRLSSLPIRIPDSVVEQLCQLSQEVLTKLLSNFASAHQSPLGKLHLVDLLLRTGNDEPDLMLRARAILEDLFDEATGALEFKLYRSMLVAMNEEFALLSEVSSWPPAIKLAMVWGHSTNCYDLIHPIFINRNEDMTEMAEWFSSPYRRCSVEMLHHDTAYRDDCAYPARIIRTEFLCVAVPNLLSHNKPSQLEELGVWELVQRAGFEEIEESWIPYQELLFDNSLTSNLTESFLVGDKAALLGGIGGSEFARLMTPENLEAVVGFEIQELILKPTEEKKWRFINAILRGQTLYPKLHSDFRLLIRTVDFDELLRNSQQVALDALNLTSSQSSILADTERSLCEDWILKYVRSFGERHSGWRVSQDSDQANQLTNELAQLMGCTVELSVRPNDALASGLAFSDLARRMMESWNGLSDVLDEPLQRSVLELPVRHLHGMWIALLTSRALRSSS
jgi:hypothetical protein